MTPGQTREEGRPQKRQRTTKADDAYGDLEAVQYAERTGDALSSPALSSAIDVLLKSRRISDATRKEVENTLKLVKASLDKLPKKKTVAVDSPFVRNVLRRVARETVQNGGLEALFHSENFVNISLVCRPPTKVNVVGSFLLDYCSGSVADVAVEMPSELLQAKDYVNFRYHDKRLIYLIYIARHFAKTEEENWAEVSIDKSFLNGDDAKPVLCVTHVDHPDVTVRLIPTIADNVFEKRRLAENRRNIRAVGDSSVVEDASLGTVAYNTSILIDSTYVENLKVLHSAVTNVPAFADAVLLLEAWSVRFRLVKTKFVMAAVLADVIGSSAAPPRASREHLLRCAFNFIRARGLEKLRFGGVRVCAVLEQAVLDRCASSADVALKVVESKVAAEDPWFGVLPFLFVTARGAKSGPKPLSTIFDGFVRLTSKDGVALPSLSEIDVVLRKTFVGTGRVNHIERVQTGLYGIMVKSVDESYRKVDTRPINWDAVSFKEFWGQKAELRRFKDGRIIESLVWSGGLDTLDEMGAYAFQRHFDDKVTLHVILGDLEEAGGCNFVDPSASKAISAFDELATQLRSLEDLPLRIRAVHATSSYLRRCGPYLICPSRNSRFVHPLDIVASFESSGAWPDDLLAISAAKAAFYVALKNALAEKGLYSRVTISFLEIYLGGFAFRVRLRVDKEKRFLPKGSEDADNLRWETENRALHHDKIKHVGNVLMGNVARLTKRWLNSHLLLSQMGNRGEEFVETLVAAVMSRSDLSQRQSTMGYFCQVLQLISEFPWEVCPLAVFLENSDRQDSLAEQGDELEQERALFLECVQERFKQNADGALPIAVYHAWNLTNTDAETWFPKNQSPDPVIARRIVATARSSLDFIETHLVSPDAASMLDTTFITPTTSYDVILELKSELTPFGASGVKSPFVGKGRTPLVGLDPVEKLCSELRSHLGHFAMFLYEQYGRAQIFVVWKPAAFKSIKFSLKEAPYRRPSMDGKSLEPCRDEIVAGMRRIGHGFVRDVQFPKKKSDPK